MKNVLLVTEYINPPFDEGIKKTVYNLFLELDKTYNLKVICRYGFVKENIYVVKTNSLFFSTNIKRIISEFNADVLIYFPFSSATFASYLRFKIFNFYSNFKSSIFIALQPKKMNKWQNFFFRFLKPNICLTPSPALISFLEKNGVNCTLFPLPTDLLTFKPIGHSNTKNLLRKKYELPANKIIISHMGHVNNGRNLETLIPLQEYGYQVVIVESTSTPKDAYGSLELKNKLQDSGIIIYNHFFSKIQEIYQLSDIYVFPVEKNTGSIGMPLSVLEARGCGIPVLTTDYGCLKTFLNDDFNGIFYSKSSDFLVSVNNIKSKLNANFSKTKVNLINQKFIDIIHAEIINN